MSDLPLSYRSVPELRAAADRGRAYYSCERIEDVYGRLLVGVGARLTDRVLDALRRVGRTDLAASPVALGDSPKLQAAVVRALRRLAAASPEPPPPLEADVEDALRRLHSLCPVTAEVAASAGPRAPDLVHGIQVATRAVRMMAASNRLRESGHNASLRPYPARLRQEAFMAGVVHDIGRWNGEGATGHGPRGAEILRRARCGSARLEGMARMVAMHHALDALVRTRSDDPWERHKSLPLAISEAVEESEEGADKVLQRLLETETSGAGKGVLVAACEVFGAVPERAIVRRQVGEGPPELAVCLRAAPRWLLRFARRREDGDYDPLFRLDGDGDGARAFLDDGAAGERKVVAILEREDYERRFGKAREALTAEKH